MQNNFCEFTQYENTNSKGDFVLKARFETFDLKISIKQKINQSQKYISYTLNSELTLKYNQ